MGRAIAILSVVVVCSFGLVLFMLWLRRPDAANRPPAPAALLETREDGSIYSVRMRMERLEDRVVEEEKRSVQLETEVANLRRRRNELQEQVSTLQGEVRQLRDRVRTQEQRLEAQPAPTEPGETPNTPETPEGTPGDGF